MSDIHYFRITEDRPPLETGDTGVPTYGFEIVPITVPDREYGYSANLTNDLAVITRGDDIVISVLSLADRPQTADDLKRIGEDGLATFALMFNTLAETLLDPEFPRTDDELAYLIPAGSSSSKKRNTICVDLFVIGSNGEVINAGSANVSDADNVSTKPYVRVSYFPFRRNVGPGEKGSTIEAWLEFDDIKNNENLSFPRTHKIPVSRKLSLLKH